MDRITEQEAYLYGLITGRGYLYKKSFEIAVEFSHANKFVVKIAHCQSCGDLVTGFEKKRCKACGKLFDNKLIKKVEQIESTKRSLNDNIIPYLKSNIDATYNVVENPAITLLVIDFKNNKPTFDSIKSNFPNAESFNAFHIPEIIKISSISKKIEFINGLLDTAGFNNAGGWMPRNGEHAQGRMRSYFQIVRNWHLPVEIDNFLRKNFFLPIQTIDWGHPNIRDSNFRDYYESGKTSWSREHQVKFFPEFYKQFHFRIKHKQELFEDLIAHNEYAVFDRREDWFPPKKINNNALKAYHPGEDDVRIPIQARKHFDKFWQINAAMGCTYLEDVANSAENKEYYLLTGDNKTDGSVSSLKDHRAHIYLKKTKEIHEKYKKIEKRKNRPISSRSKRTNPEQKLYDPLKLWFKGKLQHIDEHAQAFDVSSGNLNQFIDRNSGLIEVFDFCNNFRIKPDIVGFLPEKKSVAFIEVKVTALSLKELGQLLGYCYVALPIEAWLISNKTPSSSLVRILQAHPNLLEYMDGKKIKIGTWEKNKVVEVQV